MYCQIMSVMGTYRLGGILNTQNFTRCFCSYNITIGTYSSNVKRHFTSSTNNVQPSQQMTDILQKRFPKAKKIVVNDMSGGCGSMFEIFVETVEFKGLSLVKQHMLINETLKDHIKNMHGLTVKTKVADCDGS